MEQLDAVIVGGGVAGGAMGVALGRYDLNALVLERRREVGEINRGDALQIAAVRRLKERDAFHQVYLLNHAGEEGNTTLRFTISLRYRRETA